jgi:Polypeptide deformylase
MVKRPLGIRVSFLNEEGDEIESELHNFEARMFLHNMDYVNGKTMTHWRLSEGNLDIIEGHKDHYKNMQSTIDYYKMKIDDMKKDFGKELFEQTIKKFNTETDKDGKKCK